MTRNHEGLSPALVETIAGLSAGSIATLLVHPLDIVKTRMQSTLILIPRNTRGANKINLFCSYQSTGVTGRTRRASPLFRSCVS